MNKHQEALKCLPAVDKLLCNPEVVKLINSHGKSVVTFAIRQTIDFFREQIIKEDSKTPNEDMIIDEINNTINTFLSRNLKKVINATGIIIHTNLGRAPFGKKLLNETFEIISGYNNLEFDLSTGKRGSRNEHAKNLLKFLTGAEDILVVNNAASAVMLCLNVFAKNKEVIVSRGELVEIGGSFRVPEIMEASDCKMVEVGTTNKTKIEDYSKAINEETVMLFKAHKSNYTISGFTEEVGLKELSELGKKHKLIVMYDQGCGLLREFKNPIFKDEPNIKKSLSSGIDLICFSGDKLLGGPQAGIIAGKKKYIDKLKKAPMLRALRVCKTTLALLETTCSYYLKEDILFEKNMLYKLSSKKINDINKTANKLCELLNNEGINCEIIDNEVQIGGGSLPDKLSKSRAVILKHEVSSNKNKVEYSEKMFYELLKQEIPILGILKKGNIIFDMLTIESKDLNTISKSIIKIHKTIAKK